MFNPNTKVICIDDSCNRPNIKIGRIYTVAHHFNAGELADNAGRNGGGVMLLNHVNREGQLIRPPFFYKAERFRVATDIELGALGGGPVEVCRVSVGEQDGNVQAVAQTPAPVNSLAELASRVSRIEDKLYNHMGNSDCHTN